MGWPARYKLPALTAAAASGIERAGADIDVDDCGKVNVGGTQGKAEKNGQDGNVHARTECQNARESKVVRGRLLHFAFEFCAGSTGARHAPQLLAQTQDAPVNVSLKMAGAWVGGGRGRESSL